jgi:hypothetical protein
MMPMTDSKVFGYDWEDIQRVQQRRGSLSKPLEARKPEPLTFTVAERELIVKYGTAEGLAGAGFHGIADRLRRTIKTA